MDRNSAIFLACVVGVVIGVVAGLVLGRRREAVGPDVGERQQAALPAQGAGGPRLDASPGAVVEPQRAEAAAEPKKAEAAAEWGTIIDPDGACGVTWQGQGVAYEVPGKGFDLQGAGLQNAPRALRKVSGDFGVEVELAGAWAPRHSLLQPFHPYHGAGVLVWLGPSRFLRLERAKIRLPDGRDRTYVHFEQHGPDGAQPLGAGPVDDAGFPTLRVDRRGNAFVASVAGTRIGSTTVDAPPEVQVGVAAVNNSSEPFKVAATAVRFLKAPPVGK